MADHEAFVCAFITISHIPKATQSAFGVKNNKRASVPTTTLRKTSAMLLRSLVYSSLALEGPLS